MIWSKVEPYDDGVCWEQAAGKEGSWAWSGHYYRELQASLSSAGFGQLCAGSSFEALFLVSILPDSLKNQPHPEGKGTGTTSLGGRPFQARLGWAGIWRGALLKLLPWRIPPHGKPSTDRGWLQRAD